MSVIYIHSGTEYINYGSTWTDGSGDVQLVNDISFSAAQLNAVGTGNLYTGFNAIFDGAGFKITIQPYGGTNNLNEGLIRDLSGGTIRNLTLDISGLVIDWGASLGETGILVTQKKPFNLSVDRGAYGTIEYVGVSFNHCNLVNSDNSVLLPKWFAANGAGPVTINGITLNGTLTSNNSSCGIIGTDMFYRYNNSAIITSIVNEVVLTDGISVLGANFGRQLNINSNIVVDGVVNNADISNSSVNKIAGPIIGENAFLEASGGTISISSCQNNGKIDQANIGGIIGKNFCKNSKVDLNITISECTNTGRIIQPNCGGIIGPYMCQSSYASPQILSCENTVNIEGENCGGIIGPYLSLSSYGNLLISDCSNSGNLIAATSAGIVGSYCGENMVGIITINECTNRGSLIGSDVSGSTINFGSYPFFHPNPINDYKASAGIVGQNCGYHLAQTGFIQLNSCKNYGEFVGDFTAGIASFGVGFGSQGNIQLMNCENHSTMNDKQSGIVVGLVGIDNSGVIIFDGCKNYGDISGASTENLTSGLIGSIGYINTAGNETSGVIEVIRCINENNIYTNKIIYGGIVGTLYLSQTKEIVLNVEQCVNDIYSINNLSDESYLGGIVGYIYDLSSSVSPGISHEINIHDCEVAPTTYNITSSNAFYVADSKLLGDVITLVDNGNTHATINIYDNSANIVETSPYVFTTGCSNFNFASIISQTGKNIYNKHVNITGNTIDIEKIQTNLELISTNEDMSVYATFSLANAVDCSFNILNNTVTINEVSNSNRVGGILSNYTRDLSNVDIIISSNNITINNIDEVSENIGGIINVSTDLGFSEIEGSFQNGSGITLEIIYNAISSNTPDALTDETKGNGAIFSVNQSAVTQPTYMPPTGQLTIVENILSNNFFEMPKTYLSDYYFPSYFRPYIYKLPEFPGSNYWFGPGEPTIQLIGELYKSPHILGDKTNDTTLRQIFKRAISAINEQTRFEIYPFYHIKVKANKM